LSTIKNSSTLKRLGENFLALSSLQLINYVLPLFLIPLLIQALGIEGFGIYAFIFAIATYGTTFADYGFDLSATYHISLHKDKPTKVNEIFSSVLFIKFSLAILFLFLLTIAIFSIDKLYLYKEYIFLSYGIILGNVFLPLWFFQGIEKMRFILYLNGFLKLSFFILVILLIKDHEDLGLLMLLHSITSILVGVLGLYISIKYFNIKLISVNKEEILFYLKDGCYIFTSKIAVVFYSNFSTIIVGFYVSPLILGYYALSMKVLLAIGNLLDPVTRVVYPYLLNIYQSSNQNFIKRNFQLSLLIFIIMIPLSFIVYIFAREILELISQKEISTLNVELLQITALVLIVFPYASQFTNILVSIKETKILNKILISAAILNVILAPLVLELCDIVAIMWLHVFIAYYLILTKAYFIYKKMRD
jgi:PST family polysaccharide transporter